MPKKTYFCKTCRQEKSRQEMMISDRNRALDWCQACHSAGKKRCVSCGVVRDVSCFYLRSRYAYASGEQQVDSRCRDKECLRARSAVRNAPTLHARVKRNLSWWRWRARKKEVAFDLTAEYLEELFRRQSGRCFYTGEELVFDSGRATPHSASLDRLDPSAGYVAGNVVWTTYLVNLTKNNRSYSEFLSFCQQVLDHRAQAAS